MYNIKMYISQYELIFHSSAHLWALFDKYFAEIPSQKKGDPT